MAQDRPDLPPGETVKIVMNPATVTVSSPLTVATASGETVVVPAGTDVTVDVVSPANWPPLPGDVWNDNAGRPWFAEQDPADPTKVKMRKFDGSAVLSAQAWKTQYRPVARVFRETIPT